MVGAITRKELIVHLVSFRFWVGTLFTIVLAAAATFVAARDFEQRQRGFESRQKALQEELGKVTVYSYLQPVAIRPPQALSILAQGSDAKSGTDASINLFTIPVAASGGARGNEFLSWLRTVDLTTLVSVMLGLLALLLMADSVVGEKAEGSLRLVLAHGGSRRALWAGKFLGGLAAVCLPLLGCLVVGLTLLHRAAPQGIAALGWWRIAGLVVAYLGYLSLMLWLGLLISLTTPTAARALQMAAFVWVLGALVLPDEATWTSARNWSGADEQRRTAIERQDARANLRSRQLKELRAQNPVMKGFSREWPSHTDNHGVGGIRYRYASAAYYDQAVAFHRQEVRNGMALADAALVDHRRVAALWRSADARGRAFASLSPSFLLSRVADSIAGTAPEDFGRFQAACIAYRQTVRRYLDEKNAFSSWRWLTDDSRENLYPWPRFLKLEPEQIHTPEEAWDLFNKLDAQEDQIELQDRLRERPLSLKGLQRFTYQPAGARESLQRVKPEIALLLLANLLAAWACRVRFLRLETE